MIVKHTCLYRGLEDLKVLDMIFQTIQNITVCLFIYKSKTNAIKKIKSNL